MSERTVDTPPDSPFSLDNDEGYKRWRERKLSDPATHIAALVVEINDPFQLSPAERGALTERLRRFNMAIYACTTGDGGDKNAIRAIGRTFGLTRLDDNMCADDDAVTSLTVQEDALHKGYIPYSTRPIAWHTDGYYNDLDHQIFSLLLHCVHPAARGGANKLMDPDLLYIRLRDEAPAYIRALMHPEAMTIPANRVDGNEIRPDRPGPVFMIRPDGRLHMRYTDRNRSIAWRDDPVTLEAVAALKRGLSESPSGMEGVLQPGQGLICSNVLHTRSGFEDEGTPRLLYRARYFDAIEGL